MEVGRNRGGGSVKIRRPYLNSSYCIIRIYIGAGMTDPHSFGAWTEAGC